MKLFKKGKARLELIELLGTLETSNDKLDRYLLKHCEFLDNDSDNSGKYKESDTLILIKKKKHKKFVLLQEKFRQDYIHAVNLLEYIKPWGILDEGNNKQIYAMCRETLLDITERHDELEKVLGDHEIIFKKKECDEKLT